MKKALIYVFSGTGNTVLAANMIAADLEKVGYCCKLVRITRDYDDSIDINEYDLIAVGYPIHAFNAPQIVKKYIRKLPVAREKKRAFIFKTSGEPFSPNNASSATIVRMLRRRNIEVLTDTHMLMPYNIMFRYKDGLAKQMYLHTEGMCELIVKRITSNEQFKPLRYNVFTKLFAYILRIQWFGAWINGPLFFSKKKLCNGCGKCVELCPAKNISLKDGRAKFHMHCTMCMGCSMGCPQDAIRPGFLTPWKVNGNYPFEKLLADNELPEVFVTKNTKGYFKLFNDYYDRTNKLMEEYGIKVYKPQAEDIPENKVND
ncbi:MAG: EFR1 family ferrodoxin [Clostridia bacterium]|nr:EFR1 family ferrodoxin [Clostridia bacterium]